MVEVKPDLTYPQEARWKFKRSADALKQTVFMQKVWIDQAEIEECKRTISAIKHIRFSLYLDLHKKEL